MQKPILEYPCEWSYRLIGTDEQLLREAAASAVGGKPCTIERSNSSAAGKYLSVNLSLSVSDEVERLAILERLKGCRAIKIIL
jgi:putative lipoic acid-binding regulatory protein